MRRDGVESPAGEAYDGDGGDGEEPEPEEDEHHLIVEVERQRTLYRVSVNVAD